MTGGWAATLEGVTLSGGDMEGAGCLTVPPEGLGLPPLRTNDVTFPQRDGVRHGSDWYEPRIVTLDAVQVQGDNCAGCASARQNVRDIMQAWSRKCDDVELVIHSPCFNPGDEVVPGDRSLVGPYGVIGRPRVAEVEWARGRTQRATLLLRFDATDHRLLILDADGTPGSGGQCVTLTPALLTRCRSYPRCYDMCYDPIDGGGGTGPVAIDVQGTLCVRPVITLTGRLDNPRIENLTSGQALWYEATISEDEPPVIIDTHTGTATQGGVSRTHLLNGSVRMDLDPGPGLLRLSAFGSADNGNAQVCWRPAVESA